MENSTSLRFLEASGRPSGTGRPSLPPPRADNERADELRAPRRKPRLHESASVAPDASDAPPPEPFEKVLDHAEGAPVAPEQAAADSIQSAPAPAASPARASAVKPKKVAAEEPELAVEPSADADAALLPLVAGAPPAHAEPPHAGRVRPDALPLPASNSLTPVGPTLEAKPDATQAAATPGDALPAAAVDTASLPATERAEAPQALAPEARIDAARSIEAKPASAPPAPPAENARASEILRQLRVQLTPELRSATIQLSPPELGRISIRLRVERGELSAVVRAEKRETLDALARHVPELEATLGQLGIRARAIDLQLGFEQQGTRQGAHEPPHSQGSPGHEHDPRAREHERRLFASLSARAGGIDTYA
jgi:flagellar hook-length control protein FliK